MKKQKIPVILEDHLLFKVFDEFITNGHFSKIVFQLYKAEEQFNFNSKIVIVQNSIDIIKKKQTPNLEKIFLLNFKESTNFRLDNIEVIKIKFPIKLNDFIEQLSNDFYQSNAQKNRLIVLNNFKYDPLLRLLTNGKVSLRFTEKESQIFLCLINTPNQSLPKKELLDLIWNYGDGIDTHTLETHVYSLRKKN